MDILRHFLYALVFITAISLAGCNQQGENSQQNAPVEVAVENREQIVVSVTENKPLPASSFDQQPLQKLPNTDIHDHKNDYQKPGASVRFSHNYDGTSDIAEPETVTLTFNHAYDTGSLSIQLDAQDGLELSDNQSPYTFALDKSEKIEIETQLSAVSEGKYYLSIFATVNDQASNPISRVFALALNVGELGQTAKSGLEPIHMSVEKTATDEKIILMPAEETISQ